MDGNEVEDNEVELVVVVVELGGGDDAGGGDLTPGSLESEGILTSSSDVHFFILIVTGFWRIFSNSVSSSVEAIQSVLSPCIVS